MNIHEVAEISGVSVRTLHHYDRIGLLCPVRRSDNGYRQYVAADLETLQQILFFKQCGFKLAEIKSLLKSPDFDRSEALELQKKHLLFEKRRIDSMLKTLEYTQKAMKGEIVMSNKQMFVGFDLSKNPYEKEARERWGDEAVDRSNEKLNAATDEQKSEMAAEMQAIFSELAEYREKDPASDEAQAAVGKLYSYFNDNFGGQYTPEVFKGLGQMYVEDTRFTENIDKLGSGLAAFLKDAMAVFADRQ